MQRNSFRELLRPRLVVLLLLGFSSGLPYLLIAGTLKVWLAREKVDIGVIGYFGWVGLSYSLKFLWSPFLDRYSLTSWGRRRSWMLLGQIAVGAGLVVLSQLNPAENLSLMAMVCIFIGFFSATQDMTIDAYRREICTDEELGIAASMGVFGYRIGMLVSGGLGLSFVIDPDHPLAKYAISWGQLYLFMAALMTVGIVTTVFAPEPVLDAADRPKTLTAAAVDSFREFLSRDGALFILSFVLFFKFGDAMAGAMLSPFYVQMGYSNADIGLIAKTVGLSSTLVGLFVGGLMMVRLGIYRSLWFFGVLQLLGTLGFSLITFTGPQRWALACTVVFEDVSTGMGTAVFMAFIASVCNRRYTATQFAVLSSVALLGRTFFSGFSGDMVKYLGWANFFYVCGALGLPGLVMLYFMRKFDVESLSS